MKKRNLLMFLVLAVSLVFITGCGSNWLEFIADDSSTEACQYKASKDLDEGKYDAVIAASTSCANSMQKGAAYFGKAGYGITDIIDRMIEANDEQNDEENINLYLKNLVSTVTNASLASLDSSVAEYQSVIDAGVATDRDVIDAKFYRDVFINPMRGLANLKAIIDPDGDGIFSDCDINSNDTPDEIDATSCTLVRTAQANCSTLTDNGSPYIASSTTEAVDFSVAGNPVTLAKTYTGVTVTLVGTATASCPAVYKRLNNSTNTISVTTTSEDCTDTDGDQWKCPYESGGASVDVVGVLTDALNNAETALNNVVSGESEIDDAVAELKEEICGSDNTCTNTEVSDYLQTLDN